MNHLDDPGRRRFLQVIATASGALVVGLPARAWTPDRLLGQTLVQLNPYVRIEPDGTMVIGARDPEVGQGIRTATARIIAEELDADWTRVLVEPLDLGVVANRGEPHWTLGHQLAAGSTSVPAAWKDLRGVGATARDLLLRAAAARWNVPVASLATTRGKVFAANGRRLGYGELASEAGALAPPARPVTTKDPADYTLVGKDAGDVDAHDIVTGQQPYAIDQWFGDALVAIVARCPWPDGALANVDEHAALAVDGVVRIVHIPAPDPQRALGTQPLAAGVAVLAQDTWSALRALPLLKVEWRRGTPAAADDRLAQAAATALAGEPDQHVRNDGDVATASAAAQDRFAAEYRIDSIAHATLEPPNALVKVDDQRAIIVAPLQNPRATFQTVRRLTGLEPGQIEIRLPRAGGGFGRFLETDYIAEAVLLAQAAGRPIKLMWTRGDAFAHDTLRSFSLHRLTASTDRQHQLRSWSHRIASTSRLVGRESRDRWWLSEMHPDDLPAGLIENLQYGWYALDSSLPRGSFRASSHAINAFATECFIDEIAQTLKQDPLQFRLRLLGEPRQLAYRGHGGPSLDTGRLANVLQLAAATIGWPQVHPNGHGFGLACHFTFGGYVAHAMEVSMPGPHLIIHRAVCVADLGRIINPLGARAALMGATLDGLSTALRQRITLKDGRVEQRGFHDYPLATMAQMPRAVEVVLVPSTATPAGAFDMAFPTAAPALCNAIFTGTTVRVRRLPIWDELNRLI